MNFLTGKNSHIVELKAKAGATSIMPFCELLTEKVPEYVLIANLF